MHSIFITKEIDRILAVVILLGLIAGGFVFFRYAYFEQVVDLHHEIEMKKRKNAKIDSILAREMELRIKINQKKSNIRSNRIFLSSGKSATAISELQNTVKTLISKNSKARIQTIKPFPVLKYDDYSEASLEIRIKDISHQGLQRVLYAIETHSPVLLINELNIKVAQLRYSTLVDENDEQKKMAVTMVVIGHFRELAGGA
jgi:hypothetical protein